MRGVLFHDSADIAFIQIEPKEGGWPCFPLPTKWGLREGDEIATAGFPLRTWGQARLTPNLFRGIVSQIHGVYVDRRFDVREIVADISLHPGNSGGPVFTTSNGELIGIVSSQTLRDLEVAAATAGKTLTEEEKQKSQSRRVWTNITACVPWTYVAWGQSRMQDRLSAAAEKWLHHNQ